MTAPADQAPKANRKWRWRRLSDPPPTWNYILGWYGLAVPYLCAPVLIVLTGGMPDVPGLAWWEQGMLLLVLLFWLGAIYALVNVTRAWRHARRKAAAR